MENFFEYYIETDAFHFKYAKGEPAVKGQEFHDHNEFVLFIDGKSFLNSKNIQQELTPGSIIIIPKEQFHQFYVSEPEKYVRCILGFRESSEYCNLVYRVMDIIKVIAKPDEKIISVFDDLIRTVKSELSDDEKKLFIHASLIRLLIYLKQYPSEIISKSDNLSPIVKDALNIVDERYSENLSVKSIAKLLFVSPSTLSHKFSKELNISVYRYIIKKRLSVAHELINQGASLKNAATYSGFKDYSCFYRLYKKYYKR
jgi:AraC-like DNA-binding protein